MASESSLTFEDDAFIGGLSDPSTSHYLHRRGVLDLVNKLHSYGLQQQLDLPQIAVVGSQSVGKSSLIESISGITLPRAKGTCTRCPIECRLSRSNSSWSCEVYLRVKRQITEIPFGHTITDKIEVEDRIRRAQLAILNPSKEPSSFFSDLGQVDAEETNEISFSSDLISVRISGKEVDDLSFVDLPGIIASVRDGGKESDIEQVKNLVLNFIQRPSCLILLVVSCETDIENQGARRLAKQVDRSGKRTIPVLTKPDRIAAGEHSSWLRLLLNEQERFKHGWHCVKQSDQQQLDNGISWRDARRNETDFFESTAPWNGLDEATKSRLGTQFLTSALGSILFELICQRLPELLAEVELKVQRIRKDLVDLPEKPSGDPVSTIWKMKGAFEKDVKQLVEGIPEAGSSGLIQTFRKEKEEFRDAIFRQAPDFKPFNKPTILQRTVPGAAPVVSSITAVVGQVIDEEELEPSGPKAPSTAVYLNEVLDMAQHAITRELPHNYPYAVKKYYVARFTKQWPKPASKLFDEMEQYFLKELRALVSRHFAAFSPGGLYDAVWRTILEQLKGRKERTLQKMRECIALEHEEPATVNEHYLSDYKRKFHARYKAARQLHIKHSANLQTLVKGGFQDSTVMHDALQNLGLMGLTNIKKDDLLRLLPADSADGAIEIMAEVRAYYQVAFKRFVDYIPMIIDFELLKGFDRTLDDALFKGLALGEDRMRQRCAAFLEEDITIVRRRDSLHQDLERFEAALDTLQSIAVIEANPGYDTEDDAGSPTFKSDEPTAPPESVLIPTTSPHVSSLGLNKSPDSFPLPQPFPPSPAGLSVSPAFWAQDAVDEDPQPYYPHEEVRPISTPEVLLPSAPATSPFSTSIGTFGSPVPSAYNFDTPLHSGYGFGATAPSGYGFGFGATAQSAVTAAKKKKKVKK